MSRAAGISVSARVRASEERTASGPPAVKPSTTDIPAVTPDSVGVMRSLAGFIKSRSFEPFLNSRPSAPTGKVGASYYVPTCHGIQRRGNVHCLQAARSRPPPWPRPAPLKQVPSGKYPQALRLRGGTPAVVKPIASLYRVKGYLQAEAGRAILSTPAALGRKTGMTRGRNPATYNSDRA